MTDTMKIVHEGRGGYIEIDGQRYAIEHVDAGRFVIHAPAARSGRARSRLAALEALCRAEPEKWHLEARSVRNAPRPSADRHATTERKGKSTV